MDDGGLYESGGVRLRVDGSGRAALVAPGYRRAIPYPVPFLKKLTSAYPGAALVEELLLAEEPGRFAGRVAPLLGSTGRSGRALHWGAAALGATIAIARLGLAIDAVDLNPLYAPLGTERIRHAGLDSRVRLLAPDQVEPPYALLILVGDRLLRPTLPSTREIEGVLRLLRSDGRVMLLAWPRGSGADPLPCGWRAEQRPDRGLAASRLLKPRGAAPVPTWRRRLLGVAISPMVLVSPGMILRLFGERYGVFARHPSDR